jgi:predicted phosphoadenosine phosphosulfate sulfurtransferase
MKQKIADYIARWESRGYSNGIPDEACPHLEARGMAPSYRLICRAILRNDVALQTLGYSIRKTDAYMEYKRLEIMERQK